MTEQEALFSFYRDELPTEMREKMSIGEHKYGNSWIHGEPDYFYRRMEEELYEFRQAVEHDQDYDKAIEELADIVNFALMYLSTSESYE